MRGFILQPTKDTVSHHKHSFIRSLLDKYGWLIKRFIKFGLVGASGFLVDMTVYTLLSTVAGVPHLVARGSSYWVSASWNWFWNRNFTFSHIEKRKKLAQWAKYIGMCMVSFIPNWGTYYALTTYTSFFFEYKQLALIAGVCLGMLFNFTIASLFIFARNKTTTSRKH